MGLPEELPRPQAKAKAKASPCPGKLLWGRTGEAARARGSRGPAERGHQTSDSLPGRTRPLGCPSEPRGGGPRGEKRKERGEPHTHTPGRSQGGAQPHPDPAAQGQAPHGPLPSRGAGRGPPAGADPLRPVLDRRLPRLPACTGRAHGSRLLAAPLGSSGGGLLGSSRWEQAPACPGTSLAPRKQIKAGAGRQASGWSPARPAEGDDFPGGSGPPGHQPCRPRAPAPEPPSILTEPPSSQSPAATGSRRPGWGWRGDGGRGHGAGRRMATLWMTPAGTRAWGGQSLCPLPLSTIVLPPTHGPQPVRGEGLAPAGDLTWGARRRAAAQPWGLSLVPAP